MDQNHKQGQEPTILRINGHRNLVKNSNCIFQSFAIGCILANLAVNSLTSTIEREDTQLLVKRCTSANNSRVIILVNIFFGHMEHLTSCAGIISIVTPNVRI